MKEIRLPQCLRKKSPVKEIVGDDKTPSHNEGGDGSEESCAEGDYSVHDSDTPND